MERSEIRRTTFGVACKVEISLVPVVGCYGPICQSSGFGGVPASRLCPRSFGGRPRLHGRLAIRSARQTRARKRRRGASGDGRPRPNRNRTGRQERGGEGHRHSPKGHSLYRALVHRRHECPSSVPAPTTCAQPRESRGHGRSTLRSVVLITTKPDRGADVPQMYRVRRHRRIEAPTPVAVQTCQVKQPRTMSSIATHAPWVGLSWDVVERTSSTLCCFYCSQKHTVKRPDDGCLVLRAALNLLDGLCRGLQCLKSRTLR